MAEWVGPPLRLAESGVVLFSLFRREDLVQRTIDHENPLIADEGGEGTSVEVGHGGGFLIELPVLFIGRDSGDFRGRVLAGICDPIESVVNDPC